MSTATLPDVIVDAVTAQELHTSGPYVICIPFPIEKKIAESLLERSTVSALIANLMSDIEFDAQLEVASPYSMIEKPDPAIWNNAQYLLFVGFSSLIPYGMLTSALRAGVNTVVALSRGGWHHQPTWRLLAERHMRGGIVTRAHRALVHKLDQYGAKLSSARTLAKALNADRSIADIVAALPIRSIRPETVGVAFYTGSLGSGGAERQMVNTILGLARKNIGPIRVACAGDAEGFYRPILDGAGIKVESLRQDSSGRNDFLSTLPANQLRIAAGFPREIATDVVALGAWLQEAPPAILHCWQDHCNIVGGLAGLLSGVPRIVLSTRSVAPYNFGFFQLNQRPAYRAFCVRPEVRILNNSEKGAEDYADWLGVKSGSIDVIRNGVDFSKLSKPDPRQTRTFRQSLGIPDSAPVLGTIFTIYKFKRPLLWVDAAAAVAKKRPDAHFLIVGDGPMRKQTEDRIARHGLTGRFHLPGRMEDVALALSAMQSFLLTSVHEGLPNVLLEAQMLGVPVITVDVGGAAEAIDDGVTGIVVRSAAPKHLAEAAFAMFADKQQSRSAVAGPAFVRERFGMERMVLETLASYGLRP